MQEWNWRYFGFMHENSNYTRCGDVVRLTLICFEKVLHIRAKVRKPGVIQEQLVYVSLTWSGTLLGNCMQDSENLSLAKLRSVHTGGCPHFLEV